MRGEVRGALARSWFWPSAVLVVLVGLSVSIFVVSGRVVEDQERRLLAEEGGQVRALLTNAFDRIDSSLEVLGHVGSSTAPGAEELFEETAGPLVQANTQTLGVAVRSEDRFTVLAAVGDGRERGDVLDADRVALMRRALAEDQIVSDLITHADGTRLVLVRPVSGSQAVAYQESSIDPSQPVPSEPDSPFRELRVALYESSDPDPARLVLTTEAEPLSGKVEQVPFSVGADRWLLVVGARSPRVGAFAKSVPWLLLAGGLAMSLLTAGVVRILVRRRRYALDLVDERTRELEQTRSFLENLLDIGPMVVVRGPIDDGSTGYVSPSLERLFGVDRGEVDTPTRLWERVHTEDIDAVRASLVSVTQGERVQETIEFRLRIGDGSYRWVQGVVTTDPDEPGEDDEVTVYLVDTDERRLAEEARRGAQEAAEAANRSKSEFLSRMSHELRTPLNAVLGFGQLLEMEDLPQAARDATAQILKGGRHLLGLINEVLDISRIEVGDLALSPEAVHVGELVGDSIDLVRPLAEGRGIQLVGDASGACDCFVFTDRQRAKQILLNLLSNAVKYNRSKGTVAVSCERVGEARVRVHVADTGPGIPNERLGMLFTPFERLGAEQTAEEGTGIGLALSKRLAEAMEGTLTVTSTLGQGSTFTVELPRVEGPVERYERLDGQREMADTSTTDGGCVVLHIEDNLSNLKLVERVLARRAGVEVVAAMQGRLGVELAREHGPALVLLDLHLPDMSGEDVLHRLRDDPVTASIPVVIVSADATPGQVRRLIAAGATDYLTKPIEVRELLRLLDVAMSSA